MPIYERATQGPISTGNQSDMSAKGVYTGHSADQAELQGAGDASTEASIIKTKLTGYAGDPPRRFIHQANRVLRHASPDAKKLLWEDEAFWQLPFFVAQPKAADELLRELDPVDILRLTIQNGNTRGWGAAQTLGEVQAWATENGGHCERALAHGGLLETLSRHLHGPSNLPKAVELLTSLRKAASLARSLSTAASFVASSQAAMKASSLFSSRA